MALLTREKVGEDTVRDDAARGDRCALAATGGLIARLRVVDAIDQRSLLRATGSLIALRLGEIPHARLVLSDIGRALLTADDVIASDRDLRHHLRRKAGLRDGLAAPTQPEDV